MRWFGQDTTYMSVSMVQVAGGVGFISARRLASIRPGHPEREQAESGYARHAGRRPQSPRLEEGGEFEVAHASSTNCARRRRVRAANISPSRHRHADLADHRCVAEARRDNQGIVFVAASLGHVGHELQSALLVHYTTDDYWFDTGR